MSDPRVEAIDNCLLDGPRTPTGILAALEAAGYTVAKLGEVDTNDLRRMEDGWYEWRRVTAGAGPWWWKVHLYRIVEDT